MMSPADHLAPCLFHSLSQDVGGGQAPLVGLVFCLLMVRSTVSVFDQIDWSIIWIPAGSGDWLFGLLVNVILPRLTLDSPFLSTVIEKRGSVLRLASLLYLKLCVSVCMVCV